MLRWQINAASNLPQTVFIPDQNKFEEIYNQIGLIPCFENWVSSFDRPLNGDILLPFVENDLVIGFELSPTIKRMLDHIEVPYINIQLHPIRYFEDLMFSFESNNPDIEDSIHQFSVTTDVVDFQTNIFQAHLAQNALPYFDEPVVVVMGQTFCDKALIVQNRLVNFNDFAEPLIKLIKTQKVVFKPHPHANDQCPLGSWMRENEVQIVDANAYTLMVSPLVSKFITMSSGSVSEAIYLGKTGQFLVHNPLDYHKNAVMHQFFTVNFWSTILSPVIPTRNGVAEMPFVSDRCRRSLTTSWAYRR